MDDNNENIPTLPDNADKIIFAEDFVNYILGRFDLPLLPSELAHRPSSVISHFDAIADAAENYFQLLKEKVLEEFTDISERKSRDGNAFLKYASSLTCKLMEESDKTRSDVFRLLKFCVQISTMASRFYQSGISNAPDLAVEYIKNVFVGIDIVEEVDLWKSLNSKAVEPPDKLVEDAVYYSSRESEIELMSYLSMQGNSDDYSTPNFELNGKDDPDKEIQMNPEKSINDNSCQMCVAAENASPKEPGSSISVCNHVEKAIDVSTENADSNRTTEHHLLSESPKVETSKYSSHSLEETSSKDDNSSNSAGQENEENSSAASNEINCKDDKVEQEIRMNPENVIEGVACQLCIAAMETSTEEPGPSIFLCNHVENTIEVRTENTDSDHTPDHLSSDHTADHLSSERVHKWDGISSHSSDDDTTSWYETSSEDDTSKQKVQKKQKQKSYNLYLPRI